MGRQLPYSFKSVSQKWDYIVIGSGMGGMISAALLAKLGKKVLIVEQHYVPGGFTHTFSRKNWCWDVGVHAIGEVTSHSMVGRTLNALTDHKLKWASLGEVYEQFYFPEDFRVDFPDHPKKFRDLLVAKFPEEEKVIDQYFKETKKVAQSMRQFYLTKLLPKGMGQLVGKALNASRYFEITTKEMLDGMTNNERLKVILSAQWGYYGALPHESSFAMQALVNRHFAYGGYYPVGGSQRIAEELLGTVATAGGWTRVRSPVKEINVQGGRACGVTLKNGTVLDSDRVISSIGALETVERLLPDSQTNKTRQDQWQKNLGELKPTPAHLCLYIGFKGDIRKAGASAANQWFWRDWKNQDLVWDFQGNHSVPHILYTSYPSLKDPEFKEGEYHTGEVVTFVPYETFAPFAASRTQKRSEEYKQLKKELENRILDRLLHYMPQLKPMIEYTELSTPLSTEHYTNAHSGAIYGLKPTPKRFTNDWLRPRTPIGGLYLSGSDIGSAGVIGAMLGGMLATVSAEPLKSMKFFRQSV